MRAAILQDNANYFVYASYSSSLPKEPMLSHEIPHGPRKFISQELFKQGGRWYAVTEDHYRKAQQSIYRSCVCGIFVCGPLQFKCPFVPDVPQ